MREDLFQLTRRVAQRGMLLGFVTNGRVMSYPQVVEKLLKHQLRYVHLSIHGPEKIHNKLTGDRSFHQSYEGLKNLNGRGLDLTVNCVVTLQNMHHLKEMIDLMAPLRDVVVKFSACEPKGAALRNRKSVVPPLADAAAAVREALLYGEERLKGQGIRLAVENFPYCLLPEYRHLDDDLQDNRLLVMSEVWDPGLVDIDDFNKVKGPACAGCAEMQACPGVFVETLEHEGEGFIRPFRLDDVSPERASTRGLFSPPEQSRSDVHAAYPDTALLTLLVDHCDRNCHFCDVPGGGFEGRPSSLPGAMASLRALRSRYSRLLITGGEPTGLEWLKDLLEGAKRYEFSSIWMQTHGGKFSNLEYAQEMVNAGLTGVDVPLYGSTARIHDAVTRTPGSFRASLKGIRTLQGLGVKVVAHTTFFAGAAADAGAWMNGVLALGVDGSYAQRVDSLGTSGEGLPASAEESQAAIEAISEAKGDHPFYFSGLPLCTIPAHESLRFSSGNASPHFPIVPFAEWIATFTGGASRTYSSRCSGCVKREQCGGIDRLADGTIGDEMALVPFQGVESS